MTHPPSRSPPVLPEAAHAARYPRRGLEFARDRRLHGRTDAANARLHRAAGADGRPLFRRRATQTNRHPCGSRRRPAHARRARSPDVPRLALRRSPLHASAWCRRRRLAVRRARRLFGCTRFRRPFRHARPAFPARLPVDRRRGHRALRHDLPGLVSRSGGPPPLQDPHRPGRSARRGIHLPTLFRRRAHRPHPRAPALSRRRREPNAQRRRRNFPGGRRETVAAFDTGSGG